MENESHYTNIITFVVSILCAVYLHVNEICEHIKAVFMMLFVIGDIEKIRNVLRVFLHIVWGIKRQVRVRGLKLVY